MIYKDVEMDPRVFAVLQMAPRWMLTGSRAIVTPLPPGRDQDFIVEVPHPGSKAEGLFHQMLEANGFFSNPPDGGSTDEGLVDTETSRYVLDGPEYKTDLILISNPHVYDRWETATRVAKMLNVQERKHRVALFRAIRSGKWYDPEKPEEWPQVAAAQMEEKTLLANPKDLWAPTKAGLDPTFFVSDEAKKSLSQIAEGISKGEVIFYNELPKD